jgi:NAD(P)-dependent dehydrogenase (short-subunit alcohol dehydrogenase family)
VDLGAPSPSRWLRMVDDWWRAIDVNLRGQILCAHRVLPGMIAAPPRPHHQHRERRWCDDAAYCSVDVTSEAALICFAKCLAAEVKPHCIAVFAIRPGNRAYQDERVFAQFAERPDLTSPVPQHFHRGPRVACGTAGGAAAGALRGARMPGQAASRSPVTTSNASSTNDATMQQAKLCTMQVGRLPWA